MANTHVKSMLDPIKLDVDGKPSHAKRGVHPSTNYHGRNDEPPSPNDSGEEELQDDIAKAQSLSLRVSQISNDASKFRSMRTILRGDYDKIELDAKEGLRRQRLYVVATDMSEEAAYALEWTVGTVLRDGDTMFAIYAMDINDVGADADNFSTSSAVQTETNNAPKEGDGQKLMESTYNLVRVMSTNIEKTISGEAPPTPNFDISASRPSSHVRFSSVFGASPMRGGSKAERERIKAAEAISDRCIALLRKTKLQVRIIIDVVHTKSPKHIITEVVSSLHSRSPQN
jgi:hypothetical protein